jgi:uncharacterized RDD family membrane protein YckC
MAAYGQLGGVRYGGFWIRFVAYLIDGVILFVANLVISLVLSLLITVLVLGTDTNLNESSNTTLNLISFIVSFVLSAGYFSFYWAGGQTWGMRWLGLRVVDAETGGPIGVGRGFTRWLGFILSGLACYVGLIWAAFDARKQGWHDKLANSVVVQV